MKQTFVEADLSQAIAECADQVMEFLQQRQPFRIVGGGSKLGRLADRHDFAQLSMMPYQGIISYEPTEMYISVLSGTSMQQLQKALKRHKQRLACDAPVTPGATVGGVIATAASGSASLTRGRVRDALLGVNMVNGLGKPLTFGGALMKNVAGFDVAKLSCGSYGRLGVLVGATFRLQPSPQTTLELVGAECEAAEALQQIAAINQHTDTVSAVSWYRNRVILRLEGSQKLVEKVQQDYQAWKVMDDIQDQPNPWDTLAANDLSEFVDDTHHLIRLHCLPNTPIDCLPDVLPFCIDWCGAVRWYRMQSQQRLLLLTRGIFAQLVAQGMQLFQYTRPYMLLNSLIPMSGEAAQLHRRIMNAFDPQQLCNPDLHWYGV